MINWFKINSIEYGWFEMCISTHYIVASDFMGYDMPQKFLSKVFRVLTQNTEEWLYLMNEPGAGILHIYLKDKKMHFACYGLSVESTELDEDEKTAQDKCQECWFDIAVDIQNAVDGIVTEFSLYQNGNGRRLYEEHWFKFPEKEFEKLKAYAFELQKTAGEFDELLCTTFLKA